MNTSVRVFIPLLWAMLLALSARGQGTAFTYQGTLADEGLPASGTYDLRFAVHDAAVGGGALGNAIEFTGVPIRNGMFQVTLDFGQAIFIGAPRWLQVSVRAGGGSGDYTVLLPRQAFASTPYAIAAATLTGPLSSEAIFGAYSNAVLFANPANNFVGTFDGNGARLAGLHAGNIATGVLPVVRGGTGAGTAAGARASLGAAARGPNSDITSLSGLDTPLSIEQGGTGASSASNAMANLGAASLTESNTFGGVNLMLNAENSFVGTFTGNGAGLAGLNAGGIASGVLPAVRGGTGASSAGAARANLGAAARGPNADITSLSGLVTPLSLEQGGTGANTASNALVNLGAASLTEWNEFTGVNRMINASNSFAGVFSGNGAGLAGLNAGNMASGVVPLIRGGTGAGTPAGARASLGSAASGANSDITSLSGLVAPWSIEQGGTGANTASNALARLGAASLTESNRFAGVNLMIHAGNRFAGAFSGNGAELAGLDAGSIATGVLPVQRGGTGAGTQAGARAALGAAGRGTNSDITALSGLVAPLSIAQGGTGASNGSNALANLRGASLTGSNTFDGVTTFLHPANRFTGNFTGSFTGNGARLSSLDAGNLTTGVLPGPLLAGSYGNAVELNNPANAFAGIFSGDGTALVNLDASQLAVGTVSDDRLSANVALLTGSPAFAGSVSAAGDLSAVRLNVGSAHTLTGTAAAISGGANNMATGNAATVPGGENNAANGDFSLAAGHGAKANHPGTLVWADATNADFTSTGSNQFLIRAGGGVGINTTQPAGKALLVNGTVGVSTNHTLEFGVAIPGKQAQAGRIGYETLTPGALDIVGAGTNTTSRRIKFWAEGGAIFNGTGTNALMTVVNTVDEPTSIAFTAPFSTWRMGQNKPPDAPNAFDSFFIHQQNANATRLLITDTGRVGLGTNNPGHPLHLANGAHCTAGGVWNSVSDRDAKTDFAAVNPREVLSRVASMPVSQWRYKIEGDGVKHLGPTAQDFHAAFGLGESDRAIGSVDANGVALAAIQGLNTIVREKEAEIQALQSKNRELERRLGEVETVVRRVLDERQEGVR